MRSLTLFACLAGLCVVAGAAYRINSAAQVALNSRPALKQSPPGTRRVLSLIAVLADPRKYHGQEIEVQAFFSHSRGEWVLAPDLVSLSQDIAVNCLNLDLKDCDQIEKLLECGNPGVCFLVGTIDADDFGPREYSGLACTFRAKKCKLGVKLRPEK